MPAVQVTFQVIKNWDPDEIVTLYRSAGWWDERYEPVAVIPLIQGSFRFVVGTTGTNGQAVAMGRILSDQIEIGIIQDLCVLEEMRGKGIGRELLTFLIREALKADLGRIILVGEPGTESFYKKSGFIREENVIFLIRADREEKNDNL